MSETTYQERTHVFLKGDPSPIGTDLTVTEVAALLAEPMMTWVPAFVRIPGPYGDALVRPGHVVAILPTGEEE